MNFIDILVWETDVLEAVCHSYQKPMSSNCRKPCTSVLQELKCNGKHRGKQGIRRSNRGSPAISSLCGIIHFFFFFFFFWGRQFAVTIWGSNLSQRDLVIGWLLFVSILDLGTYGNLCRSTLGSRDHGRNWASFPGGRRDRSYRYNGQELVVGLSRRGWRMDTHAVYQGAFLFCDHKYQRPFICRRKWCIIRAKRVFILTLSLNLWTLVLTWS